MRRAGQCEHLYLLGNCPYCEIERLRAANAQLRAEVAVVAQDLALSTRLLTRLQLDALERAERDA